MPGPAGTLLNQGYPQAPGPGGYQGPMNRAPTAENMPGGIPSQQSTPANRAGIQPTHNDEVVGAPLAGTLSGRQETLPNTKPAKRGFLSTILEWFPFLR